MFQNQETPYSSRGGFMSRTTPIVRALLIINVSIFVLDLILEEMTGNKLLRLYGTFSINSAISSGAVWEFITFQFLHFGIAHLLLNMIGIFIFGPIMERYLGSKKFIFYYLVCGIGGALLFSLLTWLNVLNGNFSNGILGASAGIYGILIGVAIVAPAMKVTLLFPPVTLTMRQLAYLALGFAVFSIALRFGGNEGGEAGHLGGAIVGFLLMKFPAWERFFDGSGSFRFGGQSKGPRTDIEPKIRPRTVVDLRSQDKIDRILDKISEHGFQSLTDEERDLLQQASQKTRD